MRLRNISFGPILDASGVQGFFGEGYWHHKLFEPIGLNFEGCTFVAKTTTLEACKGNMPAGTIFPKCVKVYPWKKAILNAVGLPGPGAKALFETGKWQERTEPFFISFMAVAPTIEERLAETQKFVELFKKYLPGFHALVGLQINFSCPNVGIDIARLTDEVSLVLKIASVLGIPLMPKFNVLTSVEAIKAISEDKNCDAICISNTIPWGKIPGRINWKELSRTGVSPLAEFGGGGLSGRQLFPLVVSWLYSARRIGIKKPINAGGGILCPRDLSYLHSAGASSVFIGSVATLRPWRVPKIIKRAYLIF